MDKLNPQFHNAKQLFKIIMPELVSVLYLTDLINQHSLFIVLYVDYCVELISVFVIGTAGDPGGGGYCHIWALHWYRLMVPGS